MRNGVVEKFDPEKYREYPFIIALSRENAEWFASKLLKYGIDRFVFYDEIIDIYKPKLYKCNDRYWDRWERDEGYISCLLGRLKSYCRRMLTGVVISVGQACSLKCINCGTLSPYTEKKYSSYDVEMLIESIRNLFEAFDFIPSVQIQGGEPFLYKDLFKLLMFLKDLNKIGWITIATNGTIVPNERIVELLDSRNITVRVSDYKGEFKKNVEFLRKKNIAIEYYSFASGNGMWYDLGFHEIDDESSPDTKFINCKFHDCITLDRGKLAYCSRAINAPEVQGFSSKEEDYCDLFSEEYDNVYMYCMNPHFMEACRYCNGTEGELIEPAIQI